MNFLITSGRKKGFSFTVAGDGVKIGRSKSNDVVLDDESISGKHARMFIEDGAVVVEDTDSINGIEVNGKAAKRAKLEKGDVVTIGMTQITAVGEEEKEAAPADEPSEAPDERKITGKTKPARRKSSPLKNALALILVFAVGAMAVYVFKFRKQSVPGAPASAGAPAGELNKGMFRLRYEKVKGSKDNIFRYEMRIENSTLSVAVDDLKQGRSFHPSKEITTNQVADLRSEILSQEILALPARTEGKSQDVWEASTLSVVIGSDAKTIQVVNRIPPENFRSVCSKLETFVETELGMPNSSMTADELRKRAQDASLRARKLFDERSVNADNLYRAIKAYDETIWLLETIEPKPPIYAEAIHGKQVASEELDGVLSDHQFRATRAIQLKEWKTAKEELTLMLQKIPDQTDKRNQEARNRLIDVEKRLQPR